MQRKFPTAEVLSIKFATKISDSGSFSIVHNSRSGKIPQKNNTSAGVACVRVCKNYNLLFCVFDVLFVKFLDGEYEFCGVESVFKNEFENLVIFGNFDILCKFIGNRRVVFQPERP